MPCMTYDLSVKVRAWEFGKAPMQLEIDGRASVPLKAPNPLTELFSQAYCLRVGIQDIVKAPVKTGRVQEVDVTAEFHHDD